MADGAGWASPGGQPQPGQGVPPQWGQPQAPPPAPDWGGPQQPADWVQPQQPEQPQRWGTPQPAGPGPGGPGPGGQGPGGQGPGGQGPGAGPGPNRHQQWGPRPLAPKPGVIALRPLGVGEILDGSFAAMRLNPGATLGITLATTAVVETISTIMTIVAEESSTGVALLLTGVSLLLNIGLGVFLSGVLSVVVSEATLGTKVSVGDAARRIAPRLPGLLGLTVVVVVLTVLGLVAFVVGAVYVGVVLTLATPAYVLEGGTVGDALRRSRLLVKNAWWRTFGILVLTSVVFGFLTMIFLIASTLVLTVAPDTFGELDDLTVAGHVVTAVGNLFATTIATPVLSGAIVLMYIDRRIRREGLDVTLAETARARAAEQRPGWQ